MLPDPAIKANKAIVAALLIAALGPALCATAVPAGNTNTRGKLAASLLRHSVGSLRVQLRADTQTLVRLSPADQPDFSFTPAALEPKRSGTGYNHVGDLHLRVRAIRATAGAWVDCSTSIPQGAVKPLAVAAGEVAAADISAALGAACALQVERHWSAEGDAPVLRFKIRNAGDAPIELGAIGMPMVFDNLLTGRSLASAHAQASFADPSIALDAGYVQVTRLNGSGPALLVLPETHTPLEACVPLPTTQEAPIAAFRDGGERSQTSEGFYDWTVRSLGYLESEWRGVAGAEWNASSSEVIAAGATRTFGVRLLTAPSIRAIETTLAAQARPVAVAIPGYVVPAARGSDPADERRARARAVSPQRLRQWRSSRARGNRAPAPARKSRSGGRGLERSVRHKLRCRRPRRTLRGV